MCMLGVEVWFVNSGSKMLKDVINEVIWDWINNFEDIYYIIGLVVGLYLYLDMVVCF